ncbi:MAG: hypothetical protein IJO59_03420, partial [Clostridia bacterium]|nr:hypothetical protein [Clostridia bacterium]
VKTWDRDRKADYSQALLACSVNRRIIAACPLAFGEVGVKDRVRSVLRYKRPAVWVSVIALVLCVTTGFCFLTDPLSPPDELPTDTAVTTTTTATTTATTDKSTTGATTTTTATATTTTTTATSTTVLATLPTAEKTVPTAETTAKTTNTVVNLTQRVTATTTRTTVTVPSFVSDGRDEHGFVGGSTVPTTLPTTTRPTACTHVWSDWEITVSPTCTSRGSRARTCGRCGLLEQETLSATGHQESIWIIHREPTTSLNGWTYTMCYTCGREIQTSCIPPISPGHSHKEVYTHIVIKANCTQDGLIRYYCSCAKLMRTEVVPAHHRFVTAGAVEATCTKEGKTEKEYCWVCGEVKKASVVLPKLDHQLVNGVCACGYRE